MIKSAVFDIGGTLMEYKGMPCVWVDYYENGFLHVCEKLLPQLTEKNIADGMEILRGYNPSIKFREADYSYERIFGEIVRKWGVDILPEKIAYCFFEAFPLKAYTYPETVPVLQKLPHLPMSQRECPTNCTKAIFLSLCRFSIFMFRRPRADTVSRT